MVMEVMDGPTDDDYSQVIVVPPFRLHQSYSLAGTNRSLKPEKDSVLDHEEHATMSGSRVEAIRFSAGRGRRITTSGLSTLHLGVRR